MGHHFISYSTVDATDFAVRLVDQLAVGPPAIHVWLDKRELKPGLDWDEQIAEAIRNCDSVLFVMSPDSVTPKSVCKTEWTCALKYGKPVIPLRLHRDAELPFRLEPREYIDFSENFGSALARLRNQLGWWAETAGLLQMLKDRLADAKRNLARAYETDRPRILDEISELEQRISRLQEEIQSRSETARLQKTIAPAIGQESGPEKHTEPVAAGQSVNLRASSYSQGPPLETPAGKTKSWEPAVLERARKDVAVYIGPMARVIVRRAARSARSLDELYEAIAAEIPSPTDRQEFLASRPI